MVAHEFGGGWTSDKLDRVRKYLEAYTIIFDRNERARKLFPIYVDAFAGTGYRSMAQATSEMAEMLPELTEPDNEEFLKGSARIALEVEPSFKRYIFIEKDPERSKELEGLKSEFPQHAHKIQVKNKDANPFLMNWCRETDWRLTRAVVFLDPYGMQVEWQVIETIARTKGIDGTGFRAVINTNAEAGQTVFHLHVHVMGGRVMGWPPG